MDDAVLYLALIDHQYDQHPLAGQRQKLHLTQLMGLLTRHGDKAGLGGDIGQQQGRRLYQLGRGFIRIQLRAQRGYRLISQRLHLQQGVDKQAIPLCGGHATRGGVWRVQVAPLLQIRHHIANRGRADRQAG